MKIYQFRTEKKNLCEEDGQIWTTFICSAIDRYLNHLESFILDLQATIAAAMSEKSPFSTPMNRKEEANLARDALATANSDHLTIYNAYQG